MYLTRHQRLAAAIDPTVIERERQAVADHQRRVRLLDKLARAAGRVEQLERYQASGVTLRRRELPDAIHRLEHFTAAAERAGLIRPRKETAQ